MAPEKLTYMANQIAAFFRSRPHEEAVAGVADHISKFWEPRMRTQLFEMLEEPGSDFDLLVIEARDSIRPVDKHD
ncbi:formate dehydrogenase [Martelella lutilitoris]|uniref:Formate dehydrogenase n=1 Tax=Martelella lutilitoris TaxID=2583532 RepID=A0A5C4JP54_9HYPH|nr:formate dehydrogenase subunit delta [Martelella lutilitoris]TNB46369.1 formate dehydrogenase [Martelella lutilitoris]